MKLIPDYARMLQLFFATSFLRLLLSGVSIVIAWGLLGRLTLQHAANLIEVSILLAYLYSAKKQSVQLAKYLRIGLLLGITLPILAQVLWINQIAEPTFSPVREVGLRQVGFAWLNFGSGQLTIALFIVLVFVAWLYNFRAVVFYCLITGMLEYSLNTLNGSDAAFQSYLQVGLITSRTTFFLIIGYLISRLIQIQKQQELALSQANRQLTQFATTLEQLTISRERNYMARELHDTLAHTLSAVSIKLEAAKVSWDTNPPRSHSMLNDALGSVRSGLMDTRRALQSLRATPLEDQGLLLAIKALADQLAQQCGFSLALDLPTHISSLEPDTEHCVYRVVQEGLTNISRHANAQNVWLTLQQSAQELRLMLRDDGRGFDIHAQNEGHYGLVGMREHASRIGGQLSIDSQMGVGTTLELVLEMRS